MNLFKHYQQQDAMDCGPTCLRMIARHYGKAYSQGYLRDRSDMSREGVSLAGIAEAAEAIGFRTVGVLITFDQLAHEAPLPCIAHWDQNHFVVVYRTTRHKVFVADPAKGLLIYDRQEFKNHWLSTRNDGAYQGIALLLEPTPAFYDADGEKTRRIGFGKLATYLFTYRSLMSQLGLGLLAGSLLQLIFPFLAQSVVDIGVSTQNLNFVYLVLAAQLMLFAGRVALDFLRSWILLHVSTRINIAVLSDFFVKLMKLPCSFFDVKLYGDIMQRIHDHHRIENFLTSQSLSTLFSVFNLLILSGVLAFYHPPVFFVFLVSGVLYAAWVILFLSKRRVLNFKQFDISARNQSSIVQLIQGMQEIKLANAERQKRWDWENIQARLFYFNVKSLALNQYQQAGAFFFNEGKNILITFLSAKAVIDGQMTLGTMLAVQYIIGQLNGPIEQLIGFVQTLQDAHISMERLNEVHALEDEEPDGKPRLTHLPAGKSLVVKDLSFCYPGSREPVLRNLNFCIPEGGTTAIVGMSGSGKTTLLKLLLKFHEPTAGAIAFAGSMPPFSAGQPLGAGGRAWPSGCTGLSLQNVSHRTWRSRCGVVMQEGYIFSDTIAGNIAVGSEKIDVRKLLHAVRIANIQEFIESLP
ncbi:MAG: ATP-binding cassette domain-containing protein, partial [Cytophagales bacterium]|nr:ATP-binding cassette domain-containing protein [Cytophagales bacterium]